ncbi:MAG: hypothetical protein ACI8RD_012337, partial [Bacillariaceae sp.]
ILHVYINYDRDWTYWTGMTMWSSSVCDVMALQSHHQ